MSAMGRRREQGPFDIAALEAAALAYLNRYDCSVANMRRVLMTKIERARREERVADLDTLLNGVDELLARLTSSQLLDDQRYAETRVQAFRRRGDSARAIRAKLREKGVEQEVIDVVLESVDGDVDDPELAAARALVRRRRLGPFRSAPAREQSRRRDFAALARAGFSYDTSRQALDDELGEDFD